MVGEETRVLYHGKSFKSELSLLSLIFKVNRCFQDHSFMFCFPFLSISISSTLLGRILTHLLGMYVLTLLYI